MVDATNSLPFVNVGIGFFSHFSDFIQSRSQFAISQHFTIYFKIEKFAYFSFIALVEPFDFIVISLCWVYVYDAYLYYIL